MPVKITNPAFKKLLKNEIVRFFLSTGVGFIVDAIVYYLVYHYAFNDEGVKVFNYLISRDVISLIISYSCCIICNFLLTKYFVFAHSKLSSRSQFLRFFLVAFVGFFANLLMLRLFVYVFKVYPPLARIIAALSLGIASYFVHKFFSFNIKRGSK
ncbi:GtrA family protein [Mucilaginibacter arboris]|uniref:GtrA family protein n=1 Tax=Mucilaginibacter arboris TaxID=2682090 RepID=A0A7K1SU36_9SPHI|nr:GtrA family protein [Mucilaginibacter arboris]MVN20825.1 GtrA family protein [Mucilaginibacter arboris]